MKLDVHEFVPRHSLNTVVTPFFDLNCDGVDVVDDTKRKLNDDAARVMLSAIRLVMTEDGGTDAVRNVHNHTYIKQASLNLS